MNVYKINKQYLNALNLFNKYINIANMQMYVTSFHCCGELANINEGKRILSILTTNNHELLNNISVISSIISFYSKCGNFNEAILYFKSKKKLILNEMKNNNKELLFLHTSILNCFAKIGNMNELLKYFKILKNNKIKLDDVIYCIIINACSHSGYIDNALLIYDDIINNKIYSHPNILTCIVDCLSKKNYFDKSLNIYNIYKNELHYKHKLIILTSLLSSCNLYNNLILAENIFYDIKNCCNTNINDIWLKQTKYSTFVTMSNLYSKNGMFNEANALRKQLYLD